MGGAEDLPQRASSPLKRRASDLEAEAPSSQREDVDMIPVPPSDPPEPSTQTSRTKRAQSIDMLRNEGDADTSNGSSEEQNSSTPATTTNAEAGMSLAPYSVWNFAPNITSNFDIYPIFGVNS